MSGIIIAIEINVGTTILFVSKNGLHFVFVFEFIELCQLHGQKMC